MSTLFWFPSHVNYVFVGSIGACTGAIELIGRYRDVPVRALRAKGAYVYIAVNFIAALIGLYLLRHLGSKVIPQTDPDSKYIYEILIAGLGSLVFLRSSIFKVKLNDTDVSIGPALLLDILLSASDRDVDRRRGADRAIEVADAMKNVSFDKAVTALPPFCFALMQNLTTTEQQSISNQIKEIKDSPAVEPHVKSLLLGLLLLNIVGIDIIREAAKQLGPYVNYDVPPPAPKVDPTMVENLLAEAKRAIGITPQPNAPPARGARWAKSAIATAGGGCSASYPGRARRPGRRAKSATAGGYSACSPRGSRSAAATAAIGWWLD